MITIIIVFFFHKRCHSARKGIRYGFINGTLVRAHVMTMTVRASRYRRKSRRARAARRTGPSGYIEVVRQLL